MISGLEDLRIRGSEDQRILVINHTYGDQTPGPGYVHIGHSSCDQGRYIGSENKHQQLEEN
jgi:hypothetical protein